MDWEKVTVGAVLRAAATHSPEKVALIDGDDRVSFLELDRRVDKLAAALQSLGVGRGDRVALWMTNCATWVVVWGACARLGATLVPINTRYKRDEAGYILRQAECCVLITMDRFWTIDYTAMVEEMIPDIASMSPRRLAAESFPHLSAVIRWGGEEKAGFLSLDGLMRDIGEVAAEDHDVETGDPLIVVYTSGTTGAPKGAVHSHIVLKNCHNIANAMHIDSDDIILGHMPFYHVAGAFSAVLTALLRACTLVIVRHWKPDEVLDLLCRENVTIMAGIPTHYIDLVDEVRSGGQRPTTLKTGWIGGASVTPEVAGMAMKHLNMKSLQAVYGMTETASQTTLSRFEDSLDVVSENRGVPIGDFEVAVFSDDDRQLPVGDVGEVRVRGHIVMTGYYKNPEATRKVITPDGWFRTGDLGFFDEAGYLRITGRKSDMFIVGGSNTYPAEIERMLEAHAAIKQAVVVGVPDRRLGEVGYAFIQLERDMPLSEDQVLDHCRQVMADYKVPRFVEFVDQFARTTTGKIQRSTLAERARSMSARDPIAGSA